MPRALAAILLTIVSAIILIVVTGFTSAAIETTGANDKLVPIEKQAQHTALYREVFDRLATRHYRGQNIDDDLSQRYLAQYLDNLDPIKSYLLQADIDEFMHWQTRLDDLAKRGDVSPGYIMFNRLRERAISQLNANIALLQDKDHSFDLATDETLVLDGDKRDWFASPEAAKTFWHKRIKDSMIRLLLNDKEPEKARELLIKRYQNQIKQYTQRDSQDVFQLYVNALASLYDPHTSYFSPRTTENFQINMSLSLEGIGAELRTEDEYTKVVRIIPGGPADLQGILKAEDKIMGVGQDQEEIVDVVGWRIDEVVALIRGAKDSVVRLQIIPAKGEAADSTAIVAITRDKVKLEEKSAQSKILNIEQDGKSYKLGVIDIPAFYMDFEAYRARDPDFKSTTRDVFNLLQELSKEQVDGIVLDLRNNGGGSLHEATSLTDLFIGSGPVVQIKDSNQRVYRNQRATMPAVYNGPLLVIINRLSASASEIFAGALQDYGRALIVGSQSFGKGTVQDVTGLSSGQLKLTVSKFYRVSGDSTQHRGVLPDIEFPSAYDSEEVGESHQENALLWDRIHAVPHKSTNQLKQYVAPLTARHNQRSAADPDFVHLLSQLQLNEDWAANDTLSLNIEKRRARTEQWDLEVLALENIRRQSKGMEPYADVIAWKKESEDDENESESEENIAESDPILQEAGHILIDQIGLLPQAKNNQLVLINNRKAS
ncbi:MAG: carboxy terminal-processing peptidase [Porticoccaceae bacterium]|nr:carboxy terminal-processing peptidase [Porticoccaceae bacterium]